MKKLLFLFLFLSAFLCRGQTPFLNLYGLYSSGVSDSTTAVFKNGSIFYNVQKNAWRLYENGALAALSRQANNAVTATFGHYQLGGDLIKDTFIEGDGFDLKFGSESQVGSFEVHASEHIFLNFSETGFDANINLVGGSTDVLDINTGDGTVHSSIRLKPDSVTLENNIHLLGSISYGEDRTISSWSSDQNNVSVPQGRNIRIQSSVEVSITGLVAPPNNRTRQIRFNNIGSFPITFPHEDTNSTDINRFDNPNGQDFVLAPGANATVEYEDIDNRWIVTSGIIIGSIEAPESSPTQLTFNVTGTTTADVSWLQGGGGFSLFVLSANPIASLPTDDVTYTDNLAFGSGSDLGGSVFVMEITEDNLQGTLVGPLNITGLTAGTPYFGAVFNYTVDGSFVRYNVTLTSENTEGFTTNSSASTPTVPYTITSVLTKEDSVIITGTEGNGDNRAVLMAENKEVDSFFVDDQSYSADDFGLGDEIGTGNFVTFNGATTSPLRLAGFDRDKSYSNPYISELTSLKYLLPPANGPPEFPELLRTAWIYDEKFAAEVTSDGQTYLEASALVFYDGTRATGADDSNLSNGNPGLEDYSANAHTATIINTPTVQDLTIGAFSNVKSLGASANNAITTGHDGTSWFAADFRMTIAFWIADGQPASGNHYLFGVLSTTGGNHIFQAYLSSASSNELQLRYATPTADGRWDSNNTALLPDGPGFYVLEIEYNFTSDAIEVLLNGSSVTGAFVSGTMAGYSPGDFDPDINFAIGSSNNSGTIQTNATASNIVRFSVTGLPTAQQKTDVRDYFNFLPSATGTGFANWVAHETAGFTYSVSNDSLILSGNPAGFQDYFYHKDIVPDSLGEFEIQQTVTIDNELASGDQGIGIGLINDLDTEPNRGVIGLFVTNPANSNFGRVQLYSGTGSVSPTAFTFKDQSSGVFVPEKDSSYLFKLERDIQGNDVLYSFTVQDLYDNVELTAAWTELNRTSDQYYGSTMRAIIYMNGGPFRIQPFTVRRTGTEAGGGGGEPPPPFDADLFVSKSGSDANDCTESLPCLTGNRLMQRIGELSPTVQDAFIGAGTYVENSFWSVPTNTGEIRGAGRDLTFIKGVSNLYTATTVTVPSRSSDARAMVNMTSGSSTDVTTKFAAMTFLGNKDIGGNSASIRHCFVINKRDGVVLEDINVKFFNTTGLKLGNVDDFRMEDFIVEESSGVEGTAFTYYNISTYNIGGGTVEADTTNYRIVFRNGLITAPSFGGGAGWGITGGPAPSQPGFDTKYITNTLWDNVVFDVNPSAPDAEGHNFNMEGLYMSVGNILITDCIFNSNISWGGLSDLAHTLGWTRITNCTFNLPGSLTFAMEMQISKIEIDHNLIRNVRNGVFVSLNDQDTFGNAALAGITRGDHGNWHIHHNILQLINNSFTNGIFGGLNWDIKTSVFENNTIDFRSTSGPGWLGMVVDNDGDSQLTGLVIQNNAYINPPPSGSNYWDTAGPISGGISRNNKSTHFNVTATRAGVTVSNSQIHGAGNSLGLGLGVLPTTWSEAFTGNYYKPQPGSVLINAGFGGVTIGALEED